MSVSDSCHTDEGGISNVLFTVDLISEMPRSSA